MGFRDARELVAELEFVWDQIKNNSASSSGSSPGRGIPPSYNQSHQFQQPNSGNDGPMRVLSPMSQDDEAERESDRRLGYNDEEEEEYEVDRDPNKKTKKWRTKMERALVKMTAEIAALREQIATGREYRDRKRRTWTNWLGWVFWLALRHAFVDAVILGLVLLWFRRRKDRRLEDLIRDWLRTGRQYMRRILPAR